MTMKIGIDAELDTAAVEQKLNALGQKIAQTNRTQFQPFSKTTMSDIDRVVRQFEQLRKINGDLNRRLNATGQGKAGMLEVNWEQAYPDQHSRARQMRKVFEYTTGARFDPVPESQKPGRQPGGGGGGGGGRPGGPSWTGVPQQVVQAGLRAAGPAGGVAAGALGTGMSSGFGAGLMGLMGGMLALGVGKLVGGVMEKVDQAENNNVALDRLKRTLGDVNVSFNALKAVVNGSGDQLKITYAEAGQLATQFVKLGNVSNDQYKTISEELSVGVGMSRGFGLDPSQGVGVMGQMRGVGVTTNTQESRRFALLIGETIGKSGAFAKADEVMESLANFATSQTRNNLGRANVEGYAGMFSSMVGSGIPGLDPSGAGSLLARINSSLSAGGAKGEASQYFTGMVGSSMGLNAYQTRMLREGGAFATNDTMFGAGSAYAAYKGKTGPTGSETFLSATLKRLRSQYRDGSDELADAAANHLGINTNQAMGLLSLKGNQMGDLASKYGDLRKFGSVANLAKIEYGSADDRRGVAQELLGRRGDAAISADDRKLINGANTDEQLKQVLGQVAAKYDQERTMGSDIRDSKNVLDNIKTNLADKLVPLVNEMRHGIMFMAGKDGKFSPKDIMESVLRAEGRDRERMISGDYDGRIAGAFGGADKMRSERAGILTELRNNRGMSADERAEKQKRVQEISDALAHEEERARQEIIDLNKKKAAALAKETEDLEKSVKEMRSSVSETSATGGTWAGGGRGFGYNPTAKDSGAQYPVQSGGKANGNVAEFVKEHGPLADKLAAKLGVPADAILGQWGLETGWGRSVIKGTNNLGNIKDFSGRGPKARDNMTGSVDSYRAYGSTEEFGDDFSKLLGKGRYSGALGTKDTHSYFSGLKAGGYAEDPNYVSKGVQAAAMAARARSGTPLPDDAGSRPGDQRMLFGGAGMTGEMSLRLDMTPEARRLFAPPMSPVSGRFSAPKPFGVAAQ